MKRGAKFWRLILIVLESSFMGFVSAQDIIINTKKTEKLIEG